MSHNNANPKLVTRWLNHPNSYWNCIPVNIGAWLKMKCLKKPIIG